MSLAENEETLETQTDLAPRAPIVASPPPPPILTASPSTDDPASASSFGDERRSRRLRFDRFDFKNRKRPAIDNPPKEEDEWDFAAGLHTNDLERDYDEVEKESKEVEVEEEQEQEQEHEEEEEERGGFVEEMEEDSKAKESESDDVIRQSRGMKEAEEEEDDEVKDREKASLLNDARKEEEVASPLLAPIGDGSNGAVPKDYQISDLNPQIQEWVPQVDPLLSKEMLDKLLAEYFSKIGESSSHHHKKKDSEDVLSIPLVLPAHQIDTNLVMNPSPLPSPYQFEDGPAPAQEDAPRKAKKSHGSKKHSDGSAEVEETERKKKNRKGEETLPKERDHETLSVTGDSKNVPAHLDDSEDTELDVLEKRIQDSMRKERHFHDRFSDVPSDDDSAPLYRTPRERMEEEEHRMKGLEEEFEMEETEDRSDRSARPKRHRRSRSEEE